MPGVTATNLGFPRIGPDRELKRALESYWSGQSPASHLEEVASGLRRSNWQLQRGLGIDVVPSNDFSLYDHVLDTAVMVGAVPDRYRGPDGSTGLPAYFAMARGAKLGGKWVGALEMTKWFDTNYHYLVPELEAAQAFRAHPAKAVHEFREAAALGLPTRPVLVGPVSFLLLAKQHGHPVDPLPLLPGLLAAYEEVLVALADAGATSVQLDEPVLATDLPSGVAEAFPGTYARLAGAASGLGIMVSTYFGDLRRNLPVALALPVAALHLDLVAGPAQLDAAIAGAPPTLALSLGVVDGRNVWRSNLEEVLQRLEGAKARLGADRLLVAPSCSLLHIPYDLRREQNLGPELGRWLAFAVQRLEEISILTRALNEGRGAVAEELSASVGAAAERSGSPKVHDPNVQRRAAEAGPELERRPSGYGLRKVAQAQRLQLPVLPTTTIGSFPQTAEIRTLRANYRRGQLSRDGYEAGLRAQIAANIAEQQEIGLDVLVHGEPERNDMVEYFGGQLRGFAVTEFGWAQSYGSRCVKPPIIFGDVERSGPMTVEWSRFAQSLTDKPVKGMLTGPVTMYLWSFGRNDQPASETCRQLALALRDEVADLEAAGIAIIQLDEPALREGLPLHVEDRPAYLDWAVSAFRLASSGVADSTQIHTHMCYSQFDDIIADIISLDADVVSIEAARSDMELLESFARASYPNDIGPGIWDIHTTRVPSVEEMAGLIGQLTTVVPVERLWVNPDCGLKTRTWAEIRPALQNMVEAARRERVRLAAKSGEAQDP
jgi:5-methyltetrahydropteroyltriglutamate--homocysteine methyltransferase